MTTDRALHKSSRRRNRILAATGAVMLAAGAISSPAASDISCTIAPSLGITDVLGMPSAVTTMTGPAPDKDLAGATTTICTYTGGTGTVTLSLIELASSEEAAAALTEAWVTARFKEASDNDGGRIDVAPESGPSGRAIAALTSRTAGYATLKGARILTIAVTGPDLAPKDLLPKVRSLAASVLAKL